MAYTVRQFTEVDAQALADITLAAIRAVGARHYSSEQVDAWAARHPGPRRFLERARGGSHILVAADHDDLAVAYSLLEPDGHLDMLFCHPDHTRRGLADDLLGFSERHARREGITRLYTEASELARPVFERAGYALQHRREFEIDGIAIHNYAMEKPLA
ncbi:GNAT family N-acetyltransferase [Erythrobacter sp. THAF29]|uniref:GNAT family N-acetyltransferase n=1 Tax=Erythrobacter sp. THAF29 TaxID=2587851 RepID=UPI00126896A4|nr:GNAT family N-acetyltransferase [Erythrobacter sp. THAF29]QFT77811.1 putative N-acetyltransferase YafP [Erythrobacter sp. THAF29]